MQKLGLAYAESQRTLMLRTLTTTSQQTATIADFQPHSKTTAHEKSQARNRAILGHAILCIGSFLVYLLLNRPEVLLLSRLGIIVWYPAVGLGFALMLAISPRYMPLFVVAGVAAGLLFYRQPFYSWGTLVGIPIETALYAVAAHLLRGPLKIDSSLGQRRDVMRYVLITSVTAIVGSIAGALCLWGDHTIQGDQFWSSGLVWYFSDIIGLLSVAPFLLIHVLPWVCKRTVSSGSDTTWYGSEAAREILGITPLRILEFTGQAAAFVLLFWIMFGAPASRQLFYLAFLPVIWIAMRQGIRGAVIGLLGLNFGMVASIRFMSVSGDVVTKLSLLMLATSATGLIVGSAVSERRRIANELRERTIFLNSLIENSPFGIVVLAGC
jgi:two-component system, LuxR family, sensor kinase FixL